MRAHGSMPRGKYLPKKLLSEDFRWHSLKVTLRLVCVTVVAKVGEFSRDNDDMRIPRNVFKVAGDNPRSSSKSSTILDPIAIICSPHLFHYQRITRDFQANRTDNKKRLARSKQTRRSPYHRPGGNN